MRQLALFFTALVMAAVAGCSADSVGGPFGGPFGGTADEPVTAVPETAHVKAKR